MGSKNSKSTNALSPNSNFQSQSEIEGHESCCGIGSLSLNRKNVESWETNAYYFCQKYKTSVQWSDDIVKMIKIAGKRSYVNVNKKMFIQQFNDLKYFQQLPRQSQKLKALTPKQIEKFQSNLRSSVLLHYDQVTHPSQIKKNQSYKTIELTALKESKNVKKSMIKSQDYIQKMMNLRGSFVKNNVKGSRVNLRDSVLKFVDDTMTSIFKGQQKQISKFSAHSLQVFVKFTIMLQKHLTNPQHQIYQLIQCFYKNLYAYFSIKQKPKPSTKNKNDSTAKQSSIQQQEQQISVFEMESFLENIKLFIALLVEIVLDYYNIKSMNKEQQNMNYLMSNYENLLTIITAILFKNEDFYQFVFNYVKTFNKQIDTQFKAKFKQLCGKSPQYFSIKKQYCLNSSTLKKFLDEMSSIQSNLQNFSPEHLDSDAQSPYHKCSQALLKLAQAKSPVAKMKAILECAEKITESITVFYQKNEMDLKKNLLDADQVLSIFCFILSINQIENINSHIFLIDHFATQHQKISITGYYYSVLSCAIEDFLTKNNQQIKSQSKDRSENIKENNDKVNSLESQKSGKLIYYPKNREFSQITFREVGNGKVMNKQKNGGRQTILSSFAQNPIIEE